MQYSWRSMFVRPGNRRCKDRTAHCHQASSSFKTRECQRSLWRSAPTTLAPCASLGWPFVVICTCTTLSPWSRSPSESFYRHTQARSERRAASARDRPSVQVPFPKRNRPLLARPETDPSTMGVTLVLKPPPSRHRTFAACRDGLYHAQLVERFVTKQAQSRRVAGGTPCVGCGEGI